MLCVFCIYLYESNEDKRRRAETVKNGQAVCLKHLGFVPDSTESFKDVLRLITRNEDNAKGGSVSRIRT